MDISTIRDFKSGNFPVPFLHSILDTNLVNHLRNEITSQPYCNQLRWFGHMCRTIHYLTSYSSEQASMMESSMHSTKENLHEVD